LITGATDGVGKATAIALARKDYAVVLAARNIPKAEKVRSEIVAATGNRDIQVLPVDLASLTQTRDLAMAFRKSHPILDVLINNAGVFLQSHLLTEDGLETMFQVNYLSHFLLTNLLQSSLERSPQGRVINLTSSVYTSGKFDAAVPPEGQKFDTFGCYAASKLRVLLSTIELAKRLRGTNVTVNVVHPGIVRTPMMLDTKGLFKVMSYMSLPFSISPEKGAETSVYLATADDLKGVSGQYFTRSKQAPVHTAFDTPANRERLWENSFRYLVSASFLTSDSDQTHYR